VPLAFALLGVAVLLVTSGLKGGTIADAFAGKLNNPLDPSGPQAPDTTEANATLEASQSVPGIDLKKVGTGMFDGHPVALWIIPILKYARAHGWRGAVTSGYRSTAEQARICATGVKPCAAPGTSNHQKVAFPGGAVDVERNSAAQLSVILGNSPYRLALVWAGAKDPVHFSHPHGGSY
jgi:hypothetical protein